MFKKKNSFKQQKISLVIETIEHFHVFFFLNFSLIEGYFQVFLNGSSYINSICSQKRILKRQSAIFLRAYISLH